MTIINRVLQPPSYGWEKNGRLVIPSKKELFREAFSRVNIFKSKKNWISFVSWATVFCLVPFLSLFLFKFFNPWFIPLILVYSMIIMSTHGTIWYHRFCTHKAYKFSHPIWRFITRNLVVRTIPEETYAISHHVHHALSDEPGDPYNAKAGLLYCMLSDVNHQGITGDLDEKEYKMVSNYLRHTGVKINTYEQYEKWGTVSNPVDEVLVRIINWSFWYVAFFFIGGHSLAYALFSASILWFILVRAFNYTGHGGGKEKHVEGLDFDRSNLSINQTRPGWFSGEWHNNHHLYPNSARAGFLPYQLDLAWIYIYGLYKIGGVSQYNDAKKEFLESYLEPETKAKTEEKHPA